MECEALKRVRDDMGLTNVEVMVPFVRTLGAGASSVVDMLAEHGLKRGRGRRPASVIMMCEVPSQRHPGRGVPASTSTASRSARTT